MGGRGPRIDWLMLEAIRGSEERDDSISVGLPEQLRQPRALADALRDPLTRLCAVYLTTSPDSRGPADPVARFHLGNGARLERVNWLGNPWQNFKGDVIATSDDGVDIDAEHVTRSPRDRRLRASSMECRAHAN
jgi:hypothetical protein